MSVLVILAFFYFVATSNKELGKKFYASCNFLMLIVITTALLIDFTLRFAAFDQTYCRGMSSDAFGACKEQHRNMLWLDLLKLIAAIRMMVYSQKVLENFRDHEEKDNLFDNQNSLL